MILRDQTKRWRPLWLESGPADRFSIMMQRIASGQEKVVVVQLKEEPETVWVFRGEQLPKTIDEAKELLR